MASKTVAYAAQDITMGGDGLWRVTLPDNVQPIIVNGTGAMGAVAGPKLSAILDLLKKEGIKKWPVSPGDVQDFEAMIQDYKCITLELTIEGQVRIEAAVQKKAASSAPVTTNKFNVDSLSLYWERLPYTTDYLIKGTVTNPKDGDTIAFQPQSLTQKQIDAGIKVDQAGLLTIRFIGVNCAETSDHSKAYGDTHNKQYADAFKISPEQAYMVGDEAQSLIREIMKTGNASIFVDIDTHPNGKAKTDIYGRYLGMVYKPPVRLDQELPGNMAVNLNKTWISNQSKQITEKVIPLAVVDETFNQADTRFGDVFLWKTSLAITTAEKQAIDADMAKMAEEQKKAIEDERKRIAYNNEQTKLTTTSYILKRGDTPESIAAANKTTVAALANANGLSENELRTKITGQPGAEIVIPGIAILTNDPGSPFDFTVTHSDYIDNTLDFFEPIDDRREMDTPYHLRLGDVQLIIPPLSIQVDRVSNLQKVQALRAKSSIITRAAGSNNVLTLQLYFSDLESINGIKVDVGGKFTYYMDGLRSLVAQFKRAPFLPIENEYINETLDIHSVALVNLSVATVPGFTHSLSATLTLAKFEHASYLPKIMTMNDAINYPMLRWYYQQVMNDAHKTNPYRSYLWPIEGKLNNDFFFTIADEVELTNRQNAINKLRYMNSPAVMEDKIKNPQNGDTELSRFYRDSQRLKNALEEMKRYQEVKAEYEKKPGGFPKVFDPKDEIGKRIYLNSFDPNGNFYPYEFSFNGSELTQDKTRPKSGIIQMKIEAESTIARLNPAYNDNGVWNFPADVNNEAIQIIQDRANQLSEKMKFDAYDYRKTKQLAVESEGSLPMNPYYIPEIYITSIQVMYQNQFSSAQMQNLDAPTFQFLGGQEPYIQMTFETDNTQAIVALRTLMDQAERYTREYRYGITSGFIGIENQLTKLLGVTTIMPETIRVATVPGFPNRSQVQMTLVGFDKTQKRSEALEGLMGTYSDSTKESRNITTGDPLQSDIVIIERKMRDLEVYPDLELPTYAEVNAALPYISAGIKAYHNPTGAKFVDPDFYLATKWTFRSDIQKSRGKDHKIKLTDMAGYTGTTSSMSNNYFDPDQQWADSLETIDAYSRDVRAKYAIANQPPDSSYTASDSSSDPSAGGDVESVKKWASDTNNIYTSPAFTSSIPGAPTLPGMAGQVSDYYKNIDNPSYVDVYKEIYKWVDEYFVKNELAAPQDKFQGTQLWEDMTYARTSDFYKASYQYLVQTSPGASGKGPGDPTGISVKDYTRMAGFVGQKGTPKITRERIANYIKSLYKLESNWQQFKKVGNRMVPNKNSQSTAVGICQLIIGYHANTVADAQRLCWDWRYNVQVGIEYFYGLYKEALHSKDLDIKCRPWDWAVRAYEQGNFVTFYSKDPSVSEMYKGRLDTPYYNRVIQYFEGSIDTVDSSKRTDALFNAKSAFGNGPNGFDRAIHDAAYDVAPHGNWSDYQKSTAGQWGQLQEAMVATGGNAVAAQQISDTLGKDQSKDISAVLTEADETQRLLIHSTDPKENHRNMFTDMITYDMRGRFVRAFPTFQMFVIDEGRWMTSYKLWDNLYGFNSIESIDIHRSRKIAADTCIIRMTNVYSNLTSRTLDSDYGEWNYSFWDNMFWGNPSQSILDARKELVTSMMLQTGARIHLRIGYGSDAGNLPVVFNGTITEMDVQESVTIIGQGDGIELGNIISADPNEMNKNAFGWVTEPRDLLCRLMTSRGNWFKDWLNYTTKNQLFRDNPLGIQHFGIPGPTPEGNIFYNFFNENYGEAAQNIYSANGSDTFSEWIYQDGTPTGFSWAEAMSPIRWGKGGEDKLLMKMEGQTVWKVAQTLAYVTPDYIAAVHPFEMRSTLFFGKPYFGLAYRYDSAYKFIGGDDPRWQRKVTKEIRKPYMQYHIFDDQMDIISNHIKASEEGVYTNVIATYPGGMSDLMMADFDIRFDKQKTQVVEANIVARKLIGFWTDKKQADNFAASTLRDYMKDMYKGELLLLGDPTIKPHDMCYMNDTMNAMNGAFLVKEVAHHFSYETGFVTSVVPDAIVVNDDKAILAHTAWLQDMAINAVAGLLAWKIGMAATKKILGSVAFLKGKNIVGKSARGLAKLSTYIPGGSDATKQFQTSVREYVDSVELVDSKDELVKSRALVRKADTVKKMEESYKLMQAEAKAWEAKNVITKTAKMTTRVGLSTAKGIVEAVKTGGSVMELVKTSTVAGGLVSGGLLILADLGMTILTETIAEMWRRYKREHQAVLMIPLKYQGREFAAGINQHKGMVVGDSPGKWDQFFMGAGDFGTVGAVMNFLFDPTTGNPFTAEGTAGTRQFAVTQEELINGAVSTGFTPGR